MKLIIWQLTTYRTVVKVQENYGAYHQVPWGISESGFFALDYKLNYQYKAFGIPELGFKRGLKDELVVSPYSTFLALTFDKKAALQNIKKLEKADLKGPYGFYEAVDYTKSRLPQGQDRGIVKSYMSHHQGMILNSLNNCLNDDILIKRFHQDPQMKTGEFLLQERIPTFVKVSGQEKDLDQNEVTPAEVDACSIDRVYSHKGIKCHLLSSSDYSLMINNKGEGFSKHNELFVNRWRRDYLATPYGQFIYLNDLIKEKIWATTYAPTYEKAEEYRAEFCNYKASFYRQDNDIRTEMDVLLLAEELGEIRKVTLTNCRKEEAVLEITSYFELLAESLPADIAHPSFSNLFIRTEALEEQEAILAQRRKRDEGGPEIWISHGIRSCGGSAEKYQYDTSREHFINRGNSLARPRGVLMKGLSKTVGTVLDPIMSCSKKIKLQPGGKAEIYYLTVLTHSRQEAVAILEKYRDINNLKLAEDLAKTKSSIEIGYLELNHASISLCEDLLPYLLYTQKNIRTPLLLSPNGEAVSPGPIIAGKIS